MSNLSKQVIKCQRRKKLNVVERFGGKCEKCGYDKCINALEFHHIDKNKKESPSYIIMRWSWKRAKEELAKCIMLCANCHREVHYQDVNTKLELPPCKPWRTHTCIKCYNLFDTKNEEQKFCSKTCQQIASRKCIRPDKEELRYLIRTQSARKLAQRFNVTDAALRKWCKNYNIDWAEAKSSRKNPLKIVERMEKLNRPKKNRRKLTVDEARQVLFDIEEGKESLRSIAKRYGVCHTNLIDIRRGRTYKQLAIEFPHLINTNPGRCKPYPQKTIRNSIP